MRPVTAASFLSIPAFLLACTGLLGEPEDSGDTGGGSSQVDDPEPWEQSDDCDAWLDCLEEVDEDAWDDAQSQYGEDGSCWGTDDDVATDCDDYCEAQLEALADENPDVEACGGEAVDTGTDTGGDTGTDTGSGGSCVLDEGVWAFTMFWTEDTCGAADAWTEQFVEVTCDRGDMSMALDLEGFGLSLTCGADGRNFECVESSAPVLLTVAGTANSSGTSASGAIVLELLDSCYSEGEFDAVLD